jgi:hypothetical protein
MKLAQRILLAAGVFPVAFLLSAPSVVGAQTESHSGFYVSGHEVRTFQPCSSDTVHRVKAEADISNRLREEHHNLTTEAHEPVYVEVKEYFTEKAAAGFARPDLPATLPCRRHLFHTEGSSVYRPPI